MARIASIVYRPVGHDRQEASQSFVRMALEEATLRAGHGIEGDAKAGRHPLRQLSLLSHEWLLARQREGYNIAPGAFGEQLLLEGVAVESLRPGDCLLLGERAEVEITQPRRGCWKLQVVQKAVEKPELAQIGVLARVIVGGTIRTGDTVCVLNPLPMTRRAQSRNPSRASVISSLRAVGG